MYMSIKALYRPVEERIFKERSILEWKVNLPFMWIDAVAANDALSKENLLREAVARNDARLKLRPSD